ncbi:hypothetical protein DH2020_028656 [Rehmannia glutinosa]|uniref:Uncharacterized protein n=1 Tax=Rehmannia glutinosa TaxID=99300 RepID=A0ABR0VUD6_REHGL
MNLTGITVDAIRFRCGSFYRYGAKIHEFHVDIHTRARPCSERLILVRQNLGSNWSSLYDDNYDLSGYRLISPVVGLLAYNASSTSKTSELKIQAGKKPITIDFNDDEILLNNTTVPGIIPLCARFDEDGSVSLSNQARPNVCVSTKNGHFGLVVESPLMPLRQRKVSRWRVAIGGAIGAVLGGFLLSLLVVAMFVKSKKKARMEEMERRAYEEEALRVSMVDHVRAVTASGTRTLPVIEHFECRPAVTRLQHIGITRKGNADNLISLSVLC